MQSRVDLVARHAELLEAWRPIAQRLRHLLRPRGGDQRGADGPDEGRDRRSDRARASRSRVALATASPATSSSIRPGREADFERLWAFVERHQLFQAGFTILTPLPGTAYFEEMRPRLRARRWSQFDMHHLLWEPALGAERFFELYCETWRRSVLNLRGRKSLWQWLREVDLRNALFLLRRAAAHAADDGSGALPRRVRLWRRPRPIAGRALAPRRSRQATSAEQPPGSSAGVRHDVGERHQLGVAVRERHRIADISSDGSRRSTARAATALPGSACASAPSSTSGSRDALGRRSR